MSKKYKDKKQVLSQSFAKLGSLYDTHYKKLLVIPMILLFLSIFLIAQKFMLTGEFVNRGVSLKGGITITIPVANIDAIEFQKRLQESFPLKDIQLSVIKNIDKKNGLIIDADIKDEELINSLRQIIEEELNIKETDYSEEIMGSALGASFFKETFKAMIFAFMFMGVVVFLYFRVPTPSLAVILAAFSDIVTTLAVVNAMNMKLSTAGIAAFLMLIGYSVDTDILLSTKVLKKSNGTVPQRIRKAMKTGFMMSITTIGAVIAGLFVAESEVIIQIMTILLIGLIADLIYTWFQNAPLLRMYSEKKKNV
ncbi:protein translocase subunit SecF [Candidatus Woesearchaeota archaeon]|nr:protein translocase subunit SecF [Candidatus Woesearchaeota archaeon]